MEVTQFAAIYGRLEQEEVGFHCIRRENIDLYVFGVAQKFTFCVWPLFLLVCACKRKEKPVVKIEMGRIS